MKSEEQFMDFIKTQSDQIDLLEKENRSLRIWIGVVALASVILTLLVA
jgi:hypothetical protein